VEMAPLGLSSKIKDCKHKWNEALTAFVVTELLLNQLIAVD